MRIVVAIFVAISLCSVAAAQAPACANKLQVDDGNDYPMTRIADFVSMEVRPKLSRVDRPFKVRVIRSCPGDNDQIAELGMRTENLYIVKWNRAGEPEQDLPEDVVRYTDDDIQISSAAFDEAVIDTMRFDKLDLAAKQRTLKILAFVVAEAARFSDVENATQALFTSHCSIKWSEYSRLLRSWRLISVFANSKALINGTPYVGGSRAFLIAPVTSGMVAKYNEAIALGWLIDDGRDFKPPEKFDPVRATAKAGPVTCPIQ